MRKRLIVAVLFASAVSFAAGRAASESSAPLKKQTRENLDKAMHGEAFAYAKYHLYAKQARENGHPELAKLFEQTATQERMQHFAEMASLSHLVGDDVENLKDAIGGETYETTTMYPEFARQAEAAGDRAAAERFREIAADERKHRDAYQAALSELEGVGGSGPKR